jgi:hypothetical protein
MTSTNKFISAKIIDIGDDSSTDQNRLRIGNGNDMSLYHYNNDSYMQNITGNSYFINNATDKEFIFKTGSNDQNTGFKVVNSDDSTVISVDGSGSISIPGNVTLGSLTTNTQIADLLIELGHNRTGDPSDDDPAQNPAGDCGVIMIRGDAVGVQNAFMGFDESENKFTMGLGTFTGSSSGNLNITKGTLILDTVELDTIKDTSGGDLTLDVTGDIILDADGGDIFFKDAGVEFLKFSSDGTVTGDITFGTVGGNQILNIASHDLDDGGLQLNGTLVTSSAAELNILDGATLTVNELNILDGATVTVDELNILDGDNAAIATTLVDADRFVVNDNGTMKQVALSDLSTYIAGGGAGVSSLNDLSDVLIENTGSMYIGNDPSATTIAANYNLGVGSTALDSVTTGDYNTALGYDALTNLTTGSNSVAIGYQADKNSVSGVGNIAIGTRAIGNNPGANTTGYNVAIGMDALRDISGLNTYYNIALGAGALYNATGNNCNFNTAIGTNSLYNATTVGVSVPKYNTALGYASGYGLTVGQRNISIGMNSMKSTVTSTGNIAIGEEVMGNAAVTNTGQYNMGIGYQAMYNLTGSGTNPSIAIGYQSMYNMKSPEYSIAIGKNALRGTVNGADTYSMRNICIGDKAGYVLYTTGAFDNESNDNILLGYSTGLNLTTGYQNVFIGSNAGDLTTTGFNNIVIGHNADTSAADAQNEITLGTTSHTKLRTFVDEFVIENSGSAQPILHLTNTNADATSAELRFNKDSASGADSDIMGLISFYGTDSTNNAHQRLAYMDAIITDAADGSEASSLRFYVAENDATLTAGLIIAGQPDDDGEVDVTIAAGAASTTTVSGNLTVTSALTLGATEITSTGTELNLVDGSSAGTIVNSKAVIYGGSGEVNATTLQVGGVDLKLDHLSDVLVEGSSVYIGTDPSLNPTVAAIKNVSVGITTLDSITQGDANVAVGWGAGTALTTGGSNTLVGTEAGATLSTHTRNTAVGYQSLTLSEASDNTAVGYFSGTALTSGNYNSLFGVSAGVSLTTGSRNTAVGHQALRYNETGSDNVAIGYDACSGSAADSVTQVVAIGRAALQNNTDNYNIAVGYFAGYSNTSGHDNTFMGDLAGRSNTTGSHNTMIGARAGYNSLANITGSRNVLMGSYGSSQIALTSGEDNVMIGYHSGTDISTGRRNTCIGSQAGNSGFTDLTTGENNILIGYSVRPSAADVDNEVTLGNPSVTTLRCGASTIASTSDARDKKEIVDSEYGIEFINTLKPREFTWAKREDGESMNGKRRLGFIAQELLEAMPNNENEVLDLVYTSNPEHLEAKYGNLVPILVKSVQDLSNENKELKERLSKLEEIVSKLI